MTRVAVRPYTLIAEEGLRVVIVDIVPGRPERVLEVLAADYNYPDTDLATVADRCAALHNLAVAP